MVKVKNIIKKIGRILDSLTYFVTDIFLVLSIVILFQDLENKWVFSSLLFITYLATSYGEVMYHRVLFAKDMIDDVIIQYLSNFANQIDSKEYISRNALLSYSDLIEEYFEKRFEEIKEELKYEILNKVKSGDKN